MLTSQQIQAFAKQLKIHPSVVMREYIQVLFLKELYRESFASTVFFKGGTAIRLLFGGSRFSEDLDFTVTGEERDFDRHIRLFFATLEKHYGFSFKIRKTVTGQKYLLAVNSSPIKGRVFISLDFSFREAVLRPSKSVLSTQYPIVFNSFVYHLATEEILAEKIRAILTRQKGRDIFDLWFLLSNNTLMDEQLIQTKLRYYSIHSFSTSDVIARVESMKKEQFIVDLRPFVPIGERAKLGDLYDYVIAFLHQKLRA